MENLVYAVWSVVATSLLIVFRWEVKNQKEINRYLRAGESRQVDLLKWERYLDFAVRWGVNVKVIQLGFETFHVDKEGGFREWDGEKFHNWISHQIKSESPRKQDAVRQMVDEIFNQPNSE